jgi:hypothetical protein
MDHKTLAPGAKQDFYAEYDVGQNLGKCVVKATID